MNKKTSKKSKSLNTGWKQWDKYLERYVGKKVNIMEIGVFKGSATKWFLTNIATNKKSKVYAVDTWEGSPEYTSDINFKEVECIFHENCKKIGRVKQVVTLKMTSNEALLKLNNLEKKIEFDIIFIDASHEARDVLSDAILSWKLLKNGGILIFDDYKWEKLKELYFQPKIAIDSFINCYYPELDVLYKDWQVIIQKKKLKDYIKPKSN